MAQGTYRGVKYDTNRPKTSMNHDKTLVYRGVPVKNKQEELCK